MSLFLAEDASRLLLEDGGRLALEDHTAAVVVGTAQFASRRLRRAFASAGLRRGPS